MGVWLSLLKSKAHSFHPQPSPIDGCYNAHAHELDDAEQRVYGPQYKMTQLMDHLGSRCKPVQDKSLWCIHIAILKLKHQSPVVEQMPFDLIPINCSSSLLAYLTFRIGFVKLYGFLSSPQKKDAFFFKDIYGNQFFQSDALESLIINAWCKSA